MGLKDSAENVKKRVQEMKEEVRDITSTFPRPLLERPTLIFREPLLSRVKKRLRKRK